jgi:hypothetical protein
MLESCDRIKSGDCIAFYRIQTGRWKGLQIDICFTRLESKDLLGDVTHSNWGAVLMCRTGSKEHNIAMIQKAGFLGRKWSPTDGVSEDGKLIASADEESIFRALGMDYVEPEDRER